MKARKDNRGREGVAAARRSETSFDKLCKLIKVCPMPPEKISVKNKKQ
jgi:hypothetical protein